MLALLNSATKQCAVGDGRLRPRYTASWRWMKHSRNLWF